MLLSEVASQTRKIARRISSDLEVRTGEFLALLVLSKWHYDGKAISSKKVDEWLPKVHIISEFKSYLARTFQAVSYRYLHLREYIDEYVSRFNRRFQEPRLLNRLLQAAVEHVPIRAFFTYS